MSRNLIILGLGLAGVAAFVIAWPVLFGAPPVEPPARGPSSRVAAQAYPPPNSPPAPTATPAADEDGYLPAPDFVGGRPVRLADSPYAEVLLPMQVALGAGDAAWLAEKVSERFGNPLYDIRKLDSEGGEQLDASTSQAILADFFRQGSRPLIQGYFIDSEGLEPCLEAVLHRFTGTVAFPGGDVGYGPANPPNIPADAAGFKLCRAGSGDWIWMGWAYGGYYDLVDAFYAGRGWDYTVIRP